MKLSLAHRKATVTCPTEEADSPMDNLAHAPNEQAIEFSPLLHFEDQSKIYTHSFTDKVGEVTPKLCIGLKKNLL